MSRQIDIIGDIHGHANELVSLLENLGYRRHGQGYRHSDRKVVFVGDFVDRGPAIKEMITIARATVDAGDGFAVMGTDDGLVDWSAEIKAAEAAKVSIPPDAPLPDSEQGSEGDEHP